MNQFKPKQIQIVPADQILNGAQILEKNFTIRHIILNTMDTFETIKWCVKNRLIQNSCKCIHCDGDMTLIKWKGVNDGKMWNCHKCRKKTIH